MRIAFTLFLALLLASATATCSGDDNGDKDSGLLDTTASPDVKGVDEPFGRVCENMGSACKDPDLFGYDLVCVGLQGGPVNRGFCTRQCSDVGTECDGVPNGQMAGCFITENVGDAGAGSKYCGFICKSSEGDYTCPGTLTCGKADAQGNAFCLPPL